MAPAGTPFGDTSQQIGALGYAQAELFIEGTARSYVPTSSLADVTDGRWDAAPTGPTAAFKSRLLVRYPTDPAKFNGTVLVEWLNVSAGRDGGTFDLIGEWFMRNGYVWVGVSAQAIGVTHLRETADPSRYSSLVHSGDSYSYDIFSQAAQALRAGSPAPLGDLTHRIEALVAWGASQSGSRLFTYINAVHPTARVIDAFIPFITGRSAPLSQGPLPEVRPPTSAQAVIRTDVSTPVLFQNSESELVRSARGLHSQPDSAYFRLWEHAGTAHAARPPTADASTTPAPASQGPQCTDPPPNDLNVHPVWRAMIHAMHVWVQNGTAPSAAPRVALSIPADPTQPATIEHDPATGLAKSGIRLPDVAVPTRTLSGTRTAAALEQNPRCRLNGSVDAWNGDRDPWDSDPARDISPNPEPTLAALYGNGDAYVAAVSKSADELVARGFLLEDDARQIVEKAKADDIK